MLEDTALEGAELGRRLEPELVQCRARVAVRGEGVGLAAGAIERHDALRLKVLPMRMTCDEGVELRDEARVASGGEIGIDSRLEGRQATLLEWCGAGPGEGLAREVGERRAAPERERVVQLAGGDQPLEPLGVELALVDADEISGRAGLDPVGAERAAERVDVHLERVLGACGR